MFRISFLKFVALSFLSAGTGQSAVVIDSTIVGNRRDGFGSQTHVISEGLDATGSDKIVVAVSTEHNFGGTSQPNVPVITLGDEELNLVVSQTSETAGRVSIFYLDEPGSGDLVYQETGGSNGSSWTVLLLSGTLEGVGESSAEPGDNTSLTTTSGGSYIFGALMTDGPTITGPPIERPVPDTPQTEVSVDGWNAPREYGVQATASQDGGPAGNTVTASWTNPNTPEFGSVVALVEILSASGGGAGFQITEISYLAESNEVTLTWPKTGATSFVVKVSPDLEDWSSDLDDGVTEGSDENPEDPEKITVTLPLPEDLGDSGKLFFRVEEGA